MRITTQTAVEAFLNLFPSTKDIDSYREKYPIENDPDVILRYLNFASKLFPQNVLMLCPVSHTGSKAEYITENCVTIFGHTNDELVRMELSEFFSLIHPEDLQYTQQCLHFIRTLIPFDPENYRFQMNYRIRHKSGLYRHIRDEKIAIKTELDSYLYLIVMSSIPEDEKFHSVRLEIYKSVSGNFVKSYSYNPRQEQNDITPRQQDIANLVSKGLTNQQIADHLNVSIFTVKNHKQTLFKKMNVKSSLELVNYVKQLS